MSENPPPKVVVRDLSALSRHIEAGEKPVKAHRVGIEHEKILVLENGDAPDYPTSIGPLLDRLIAGGEWSAVREGSTVIGLKKGQSAVSLEPGGQFEFSDAPRATAREASESVHAHLAELKPILEDLHLHTVAAGFRPFVPLDAVPWMPKGRYRVMREYLPTRGKLGLEMMKRTATVQANLDYSDQADCADKMRVAMGVTSLVTALWSSSPLADGKPTGYQSYRARAWLDTDEDRCGLLPFAFAPDASERLYAAYAEWALDVPMFFVHRAGGYIPASGMTFRRYLAEGFQGEQATMGDWEVHLSTLFPEVRLKQYLEVRGADAGPLAMVVALPAFYRGLLYSAEARRAAWSLVADWTWDERVLLRETVPREGLQAKHRGKPILDLCRELVRIARAGLEHLGDDDSSLLDAVTAIATSGRTVSDEILAQYERAAGARRPLIEALAL